MRMILAAMTALLMTDVASISEAKTDMAKTYHMLISGDAGAQFNGRCAVMTSGGETILTLSGQVPHEQQVVGHGLSCKLHAEGRIVIDIAHNGSRSRSSTNGGEVNINLR